MRKNKEELDKIKRKNNCHMLWSWSRYNCYKNSPFEFYLKYILKMKEDRTDSIYSASGTACHTILEKYYNKEIQYSDMITEYEDSLFIFNNANLKYDRCNDEKNNNIAFKYESSIKHFFLNHRVVLGKVQIEKFITVKVGNFVFIGYIDFIHKNENDFIITDFKTSSIYTGEKISKECGQLILYAEALRQLGVPLENIKIRWNFLKYATVKMPQANGELRSSNIIRCELGEKLKSNVKMWLNKTKLYSSEEIESYLDMLVMTNSVDCLPDDIKSKYEIQDCCVYVPYNQEQIDLLKNDIVDTIIEITKKEKEYKNTKDEKIWWEEITDKKAYYFANLCGYSGRLHKPYGEYIEQFNSNKGENKQNNNTGMVIQEDDLSWLNSI